MRTLSIPLLAVVAIVALGGSCSYRNPTLNRIVDPYWKKADFTAANEWYYRTTVVDAPPESGFISVADGDWLMLEKIRWEVTENMLIGWRSYPVVPGSDLDNYPGSDDVYKGEPVAMFRITDHFDIKQGFDPGTGEKTNQIVENHDRQWFDRAYFRVNWSVNLVPTYKFHIELTQIFNDYAVQQNDPGDPKRWRFEDDDKGNLDYFEITDRTQVMPDIYSYFGFYGVPYQGDTSGALIDMRHSFMRVPASDYQPLPMPPSVVLEDADGNEVRDSKGFAVRVPINDRFGFFGTLGRNTFDENRGIVQSGQIFNASRFNIWKHHKNPDGTIIPTDQREPKPIIYYTNVEHPEALMHGSQRVADEWNRAFRDTIWKLQPNKYSGEIDATGIPSDVPQMFILKRNDCNFDNVKSHLDGLSSDLRKQIAGDAVRKSFNPEVVPFDGTLADAKARFDEANDPNNTAPFTSRQSEETQALNDLERICSALEYVTGGDPTLGIAPATKDDGTPVAPFSYERLGDTRYSMLDLIVGNFQSGWVGLGPPYSDPITGETISGTANIAVSGLDRMAARAAEYVGIINGEVSPTDLTFGFDIDRYMKQKLLETNALTSLKPDNRAKEQLHTYFNALKQRGGGDVMANAVGEVPPGRFDSQASKLVGTDLEQKLITPDDLIAFGKVDPLAADGAALDDSMMNAVSPLRGNNLLKNLIEKNRRMVNMGMRAMDPPEFIDDLLIGQAIKYRDLPYNERFNRLREDIYVAIALHEVGHTTGLFHNMAGTSDALNYGTAFWNIQKLPADMEDAITALAGASDPRSQDELTALQRCVDAVNEIGSTGATSTLPPEALQMNTQDCLEQEETMYSSIMDYQANWTNNSDFGGLGPYDLAANKFAYGQLLEVFNDGALNQTSDTRSIKRRIFLNGWENIAQDVTLPDGTVAPKIVNGIDEIYDRTYVKMDWNTSSTRQAPLPNEVPYKFGWGAGYTPDEKPFDFGPDFRTNAKNEITRYFQHYFFTHFMRDHLNDYFSNGETSALNSDLQTMLDFTEKMQWLFFFEATDPDFPGSHAEDDLLGATITGLNLFGKIVGHPANGQYVTAQKADIFGLLDLPTDQRNQEPSDIALPYSNLGRCSARQVAITGATVATPDICLQDSDCSDATKGRPDICGPDGHTCVCDVAHNTCIDTQDPTDGIFVRPKPGYNATVVPQSEGRPFFLGFTDDYEDWYVTYVGTFWTKIYALDLLGYNNAFFPRADFYADPRIYDVSWYRLFPKQVSKIFYDFITDKVQDLGPTIDADGNYVSRDLLNADLTEPDYSGNTKIMPSISFSQQYYALIWANLWMNSPTDDTLDLPKSMKVALQGGNDDTSAFDSAISQSCGAASDPSADVDGNGVRDCEEAVVATFTHPISGLTYRGLKVGDNPIAYDLVKRLNLLKDRFQHLDACDADMQADLADDGDPTNVSAGGGLHQSDPYCACIDNYVDYVSGDCTRQSVETVGSGLCQPYVLDNRRDSAREIMDDLVDYVGDLRSLNKYLGWY